MHPDFFPPGGSQPLATARGLVARVAARVLAAMLVCLTAACERPYWDPTVKVEQTSGGVAGSSRVPSGGDASARPFSGGESFAVDSDKPPPKPVESLQRGTGTFVRKVSGPTTDTSPGDVTLNFDNTDLREVVKVILKDILNVNYVLSPAVQGTVSLQTGRPLRRDHLIPTLETLLRMNNAALVYKGGTYEVVPLASAVQGNLVPQLGDTNRPLPAGYSLQIIPLQYIGADEMSRILQPLAPEGSIVRVDNLRNLIVVAATGPEMANLVDTIRVFDVDWMRGLSVGFFTLEYAKVKDVVTQLQGLLADDSGNPVKGLFRFVPVESSNSLLVISPQESYIQQARNWIERLDNAEAAGSGAERLYVYRVKHGNAQNLADVIGKLYGGEGKARQGSVGGVAPGLGTAGIGSQSANVVNAINALNAIDAVGTSALGSGTQLGTSGVGTSSGGFGGGSATGFGQGGGSGLGQGGATAQQIEMSAAVSVVADTTNNSLLIRANSRDYKKILDALKQLDILPLQVLVQATIVEIALTGNLQYGVQWDFKALATGKPGGHYTDISLDGTNDGNASGIANLFPGFNWTVIARPDLVRAKLSAFAKDGLVNVLSSPSVMVMDNQVAKINVGQDVPTATQQQQSTLVTNNSGNNIINSIQYRQTGVMLAVKPRVTPGGLVQMEIAQEVSKVCTTCSSDLNSPTFDTRQINSSVAVRSNQAVVLGGLIREQREDGKQGVPGLYNLPFAGFLFGERVKSADRAELIVVITPKVIANDQDIEAAANEFRDKVHGLQFKF